jgi:hypothetical protein
MTSSLIGETGPRPAPHKDPSRLARVVAGRDDGGVVRERLGRGGQGGDPPPGRRPGRAHLAGGPRATRESDQSHHIITGPDCLPVGRLSAPSV